MKMDLKKLIIVVFALATVTVCCKKHGSKAVMPLSGLSAEIKRYALKVKQRKGYQIRIRYQKNQSINSTSALYLMIVPAEGWKLNLPYPTNLKITPPAGLKLERVVYKRKQAGVYKEQLIRFKVPYTTKTSGTKAFKALLKLAICNPKVCVPKKEYLGWQMVVK